MNGFPYTVYMLWVAGDKVRVCVGRNIIIFTHLIVFRSVSRFTKKSKTDVLKFVLTYFTRGTPGQFVKTFIIVVLCEHKDPDFREIHRP